MDSRSCIASRALLGLLVPAVLIAQERNLDSGVLQIYSGHRLIGEERFDLRLDPVNRTVVLTSTAVFRSGNPNLTVTGHFEINRDSLPVYAEVTATDGAPTRSVMRFGPRRVTTRILSGGVESAREHPAASRMMAAHDSLPSSWALIPGASDGVVRVFSPTGGTRLQARISFHGSVTKRIGNQQRELQHYEIQRGGDSVHVYFDAHGRLTLVEWPTPDIRAERR